MKKVYICGDSFGSIDPDYPGESWTEQLAHKLIGTTSVENLSRSCASNLLISLQVDRAIANNADYIIVLATSCIREEVKFAKKVHTDLLDRFVWLGTDNTDKDLSAYSHNNINNTTLFTDQQQQLLKHYSAEFFDIDLAIYRNRCIIENTLHKLKSSGIPFIFDQGGFEHSSFHGASTKEYFVDYQQYFSHINLWDYAKTAPHRPFFHITDKKIINEIVDYYYVQITNNVNR